jgi:hypothetical protein
VKGEGRSPVIAVAGEADRDAVKAPAFSHNGTGPIRVRPDIGGIAVEKHTGFSVAVAAGNHPADGLRFVVQRSDLPCSGIAAGLLNGDGLFITLIFKQHKSFGISIIYSKILESPEVICETLKIFGIGR